MNSRSIRFLQAMLVAGTFAGAAMSNPAFGVEKAGPSRSPTQQGSAAPGVAHASYASPTPIEGGVIYADGMECPVDEAPYCRNKWWHCWDCRERICTTLYAHRDYARARLCAAKPRCRSIYYHVQPGYADPRDGQVYSAEGVGIPVSSPLAPVTGYMSNYGHGIPAARLTPLAGPPY